MGYIPCQTGTFQDANVQECVACDPGRYSDTEGQFSCLFCNPGRYQDVPQSTSCVECEAGRYQIDNGMENCSSCAVGTTSGPGQSVCIECQSSVDFAPFTQSSSCLRCPAQAVAAEHHTTCQCGSGFYAIPFDDAVLFQDVDRKSYDDYRKIYIDKPPSEWPNPDFDPNEYLGFWCAECPTGAECSSAGAWITNITAAEGYYLGLDGTGTDFFVCLNEIACSTEANCSSGYTGNGCAECEEGLVRNSKFECNECPSAAVLLISIIAMLVLLLSYLGYKIKKKTKIDARASRKLSSVFAKIIMSTCQINSIALSFAFNWDSVMNGFLMVQGQATSLGTAFLEVSCLFSPPRNDVALETVMYALFPVAVVLGMFFIAVVRTMMMDGVSRDMWTHAKSSTTNLAVLILFFLQPYLVTRLSRCSSQNQANQ